MSSRAVTQQHGREGVSVLFVRNHKRDVRGLAGPYFLAGPARYVSHEGERPLAITWELAHEIPGEFYREFKLVA